MDGLENNRMMLRKFICIKVIVNLLKPIRHGFFWNTDDGEKVWIPFNYEGMARICVSCGKLGLGDSNCEEMKKHVLDLLIKD